MIGLLFGIVVFALVAYLLWWLLQQIPLPQPLRVILTVLFVLFCVGVLLNYLPVGLPRGRLF